MMHFDTETSIEEAVFQALNAMDAVQTIQIAQHPERWREQQAEFLIGSHPSTGSVVALKAAEGFGHYAVTYGLVQLDARPGIIRAWECITVGWVGATVAHNYSIGIKVSF